MTIRNYITKILISLVVFPSILFANNFPHISTFGADYWNLSNDLEQVKWLAKRHDWIVGGAQTETIYDAAKAVNPEVKFKTYISYNTYELSVQNWIKNWCEQNGYNFEDTFYHYYYDTEVKLKYGNPSVILVKGYGGGSAKTIEESRVPSSWASYTLGINQSTGEITRLNINPTSKVWRLAYQAYILEKRMKINASNGKYADGIVLDSFDGTVSNNNDLQLERTLEMRNMGKLTRTEANSQVTNDLIAAMKELKSYLVDKIGKPIVVAPNAGDVDSFYHWRKNLYAEKVNEYSHVGIEYLIRASLGTYRIARLKQVYDTMVNNGLIFFARNESINPDTSERVKQFLIASHYLVNHPNYYLMYHIGSAAWYGGNPAGQLYTTHWNVNLEYDIGTPVERPGSDYWGQTNTNRFFVFGSDSTYTILGREYTNALVLAKFGAGGIVGSGTNPVTHSLNGTYRLLQPDNSLGPPITEITLGFSEGAILIKEQQTVLPSPAPVIIPTPLPEPTPEPTPATEPTIEPTPTPEPTPTNVPPSKPTPKQREKRFHESRGKNKKLNSDMYVAVSETNSEGPPSGNIKKYEITVAGNPSNPTNFLVIDAAKNPALDSKSQIKSSSTSSWSSQSDGNKVKKGGVGEALLTRTEPRNIFTYLGETNLMSESNDFETSNQKITPELLGLAPGDTEGRDKLIQFIQGYDVFSKNKGSSALKKRNWLLGAVVNSRPLVIPYSDSRSVIFAGANDGMLHAFDNSTGEELWGFIPYELLGRLKELTSSNKLVYFVDGSPKAYITESQKIVVFGLGRGGDHYYALDVTNPDSPKFLWSIGPETTGYSEMGQTLSTPQIGRIKYGAGEKVVFFIGGGYDESQDGKKQNVADKKGRAVYVVDLFTGQQVWRWDYARDPSMIYCIPSDVSCVDTNGDGYIDRLYAGDLGGRLWRFDLMESDSTTWAGSLLFNSNAGTTGGTRKIFARPDVTLEKDFEMVFFGTGDRVNTGETKVANQIYAIKDKGLKSTLTEKDLENMTDGTNNLKSTGGKAGWYVRLESKGEKSLAPPVVMFGVAYFTTFIPSKEGGAEGIAKLYALNYQTGGPILDLNPENNTDGIKIDLTDRSKVIGKGIPSGVILSAIRGRLMAFTGFPGGVYETPLRKISPVIPIWWKEVSKK